MGTHVRVATYNAGGRPGAYDWQLGRCLKELVEARSKIEPNDIKLHQKVQEAALRALFSENPEEKTAAKDELDQLQSDFIKLTQFSKDPSKCPYITWYNETTGSLHSPGYFLELAKESESSELCLFLKEEDKISFKEEVKKLTSSTSLNAENLRRATHQIAKKLFAEYLGKNDIIGVQQAMQIKNWEALYSDTYDSIFAEGYFGVGLLWDKNKFSLVQILFNQNRSLVIELQDRVTEKVIVVATAHLEGCDRFSPQTHPREVKEVDHLEGDKQLENLIACLNRSKASLEIIAMDGNVPASHPRMKLLEKHGYSVDFHQGNAPTTIDHFYIQEICIDWIAVKSKGSMKAMIKNDPPSGITLSNHQAISASIMVRGEDQYEALEEEKISMWLSKRKKTKKSVFSEPFS